MIKVHWIIQCLSVSFLCICIKQCNTALHHFHPNYPNKIPIQVNIERYKHPLDPLSPSEIQRSTAIIQRNRPDSPTFTFLYISLQEPSKSSLLPFFLLDQDPPPGLIPRKTFNIIYKRTTRQTFEAVVNLDSRIVESFDLKTGITPPLSPVDLLMTEIEIVQKDPEVQRRCSQLGYPNISLVQGDPWSPGYVEDVPKYRGKRLATYYLFGKNYQEDNLYAHPLSISVTVDLDEMAVIGIENLPIHENFDTSDASYAGVQAPKKEANYDYKLPNGPKLRVGDKPINITCPKGPAHTLKGHQLSWQKWKMRLGFNPREGLVLHQISYQNKGKYVPLIYRASMVETWIPYGDPRPPLHRKAVYDEGDYGIGTMAHSQTPNEDVLSSQSLSLFPAFMHNKKGLPIHIPAAYSVREEDAGILWKHVDYRTGKGITARSHKLVVSFICNVGNYDYDFSWEFYQDGSFRYDIKLTGVLSVGMLAPATGTAGHGTLVSPQVDGYYHQHWFTARLDTDILTERNAVKVVDTVPSKEDTGSAGNKYGNAFTINVTSIRTQGEGRQTISPLKGRFFRVENPSFLHPTTKQPKGWKLVPTSNPPLFVKPDSPLRKAGGFFGTDFWVTKYKDYQLYPGGLYMDGDGLEKWVGEGENEGVENDDLVLWYNFGLTHIPRVEDWPVMPTESVGFWFKPHNFFEENPAQDVPPASKLLRF